MDDNDPIIIPLPDLNSLIYEEFRDREDRYDEQVATFVHSSIINGRICALSMFSFIIYSFSIYGFLVVFLSDYYIKDHIILNNQYTSNICTNTSNTLCNIPFRNICVCYRIQYGLYNNEYVYNSVFQTIIYSLPIPISLIFCIISFLLTKIIVKKKCFKDQICDFKDKNLLLNFLNASRDDLEFNSVLIKKINEVLDRINVSEKCKQHFYLYFKPEEEGPVKITIKIQDSYKINSSHLYTIGKNKLNKYAYFRTLFGSWNDNNQSVYTIFTIDEAHIKDYVALLDFINGIEPKSDIDKLYIVADAYGITDCMAYCYLAHPDMFTLESASA